MFIVGTITLYKAGFGFEFSTFPLPPPKKRGGHILLMKTEVWWNRVVILKKEGTLSLILITTITSSNLIFLWVSVGAFLCVYNISFRILCVSFEEINLIEFNQLICDFHKSVIFEQPRHCKLCKVIFWLFIECNKDSCCEHKTGGVNIYLHRYICHFIGPCLCCICLLVWYQIRVLGKNHVIC